MKEKDRQKINQAHDAYGKDCLSRKEIDFLKGHQKTSRDTWFNLAWSGQGKFYC